MKSVAILLTVYNRKDATIRCLDSLSKQDISADFALEIFLTDDGCTDGSVEAVQEKFSKVHIVRGDGSLYWNRGMYAAWKEAAMTGDYDYYLWLNDDTILEGRALQTLLDTSEELDNNVIVVGTTKALRFQVLTYGGRSSNGKLIAPLRRPIFCNYFNGNIVLIARNVFNKVGFNDPYFHHSLGDFDYGLRAGKLGIKSFVAPGVLGLCDSHDSLPTWCNPKKSLRQRWKVFRSPLGQNPEEFFVFEKRHNGLLKAIFHYATNHLRMLCPWIWNIK